MCAILNNFFLINDWSILLDTVLLVLSIVDLYTIYSTTIDLHYLPSHNCITPLVLSIINPHTIYLTTIILFFFSDQYLTYINYQTITALFFYILLNYNYSFLFL